MEYHVNNTKVVGKHSCSIIDIIDGAFHIRYTDRTYKDAQEAIDYAIDLVKRADVINQELVDAAHKRGLLIRAYNPAGDA